MDNKDTSNNFLPNKTKEELLKTPINQMELTVDQAEIKIFIDQVCQELENSGIDFRPDFYLTDEWGCPNGLPIVGVPFYLANKLLKEIHSEKTGELENDEEIQQILRHEIGHTFNYAYSLYKLPQWNEIFGVYDKPYDDRFAPVVGSKKFVRHLEGWYAQKHPDEDFAETFALLITPGFDWKTIYRRTRAYKKLAFAAELIKQYKNTPIPLFKKDLVSPIESMNLTLEDWYKKIIPPLKPKTKILILFYQKYPQKRPVHDEVVDQIKEVLLNLNYEVVLLPVNQSIERITNGIKHERPDLIFNLCETFRNNDKFEFNITALLEMIRIPFTGSSSGSIFLSNDKYLSKQLFDFHKIQYPDFVLIPLGEEITTLKMEYPLFVKPVHEDASIGIDEKSVVYNEEELKTKIKEVHEKIKDDVLVEKFIDGREFFVAILGNKIIKPLEIVELDFSRWPITKPKIYTYNAKIENDSEEYKSIGIKIPTDLSPETKNKIYEAAVKIYSALRVRDYARIDIRVGPDGKIYVLEANLNPYLGKNDEVAVAAQASGLNYQQFIEKILEATFNRSEKNGWKNKKEALKTLLILKNGGRNY